MGFRGHRGVKRGGLQKSDYLLTDNGGESQEYYRASRGDQLDFYCDTTKILQSPSPPTPITISLLDNTSSQCSIGFLKLLF